MRKNPIFHRRAWRTVGIAWLTLPILAAIAQRPAWIADPKTEDSIYLYSVGSARGMPSAEAAEQAAYRDALLRLLRAQRSDITDPDRWPMQNAVIMPGCIHHERMGGRYACWVQVRWPKNERANLVEQMTVAETLEQTWRQAQTLAAEGQPAESRRLLTQLLEDQAQTPAPAWTPAELQFQIARTWHADNRPLEARRWYERLIQQAPDDALARQAETYLDQLPPPGRFWPLNARFAGGPLEILAVLREGGDWRPYPELTRVLAQESRAAGLETIDGTAISEAAILQQRAETGGPAAVAVGATESPPTAVLLVAVDIDPAKRGTTTMAFGAAIPTVDTRVRVHVADVRGGETLYEASFVAVAGTRSAANLAENVANQAIEQHLLPHCPGLKRDSADIIATTEAGRNGKKTP